MEVVGIGPEEALAIPTVRVQSCDTAHVVRFVFAIVQFGARMIEVSHKNYPVMRKCQRRFGAFPRSTL